MSATETKDKNKMESLRPSPKRAEMTPEADVEATSSGPPRGMRAPTNSKRAASKQASPVLVHLNVNALLKKLTTEHFDTISDQIVQWANKSEKETDGRMLILVIRLVFEKAMGDGRGSELYARLCRKMMEEISPQVHDDGVRNAEGKPLAGGLLFRKYLLNRCQEDFERRWGVQKDVAAAASATEASEDQGAEDASAGEERMEGEERKDRERRLKSDEKLTPQEAKRRDVNLVRFIGELFKVQMFGERIAHDCIKALLQNIKTPEEEQVEGLCELLTAAGQILDVGKARTFMDMYFVRMKKLADSDNASPRMRSMLQDVIDLRGREWTPRDEAAEVTTVPQIDE